MKSSASAEQDPFGVDPFTAEGDPVFARLKDPEAGDLPCAAVETDFLGRVVLMNRQAKELLGVSGAAMGREFFSDLCPWANSPLFLGRFVQGIKRSRLNETFPFVLKVGRELRFVTVRLLHMGEEPRVWILLREQPVQKHSV